jgi:hypothetical protein
MKTKILFALIALVAICSCTQTKRPQYLYLNAEQLKPLGIELNDKGVFYKNENPNYKQDKERYSCLAFYSTNDNYLTTKQFYATDTLHAANTLDSLIVNQKMTRNDFYPVLIGNTSGIQSMENKNLPVDMKLLPIAIAMAETKLSNRKDTLVVWLKPTESLLKALPANTIIENYLSVRPTK